jgi:hypothetical protein
MKSISDNLEMSSLRSQATGVSGGTDWPVQLPITAPTRGPKPEKSNFTNAYLVFFINTTTIL